MATIQRSNRSFGVTPDDNGNILDMGPASTPQMVGTFAVQFIPAADFIGTFAVVGRMSGQAAKDASAPFLPFPYRRVNVNGVASDRAIVDDVITGSGAIEIPSNGWSVGLLVACTAGSCKVVSMDQSGPCTE